MPAIAAQPRSTSKYHGPRPALVKLVQTIGLSTQFVKLISVKRYIEKCEFLITYNYQMFG